MAAFYQQAVIALKVYLQRGRDALQKLQDGAYDEASELLIWRNAAFQNFRTADYMLAESDDASAVDTMLRDIWPEIRQQNDLIEKALQSHSTKLRQEWARHKATRTKIGKFVSGQTEDTNFKNTI